MLGTIRKWLTSEPQQIDLRYKATPSCIPVSSPPRASVSRERSVGWLWMLCVLMLLHLSRLTVFLLLIDVGNDQERRLDSNRKRARVL